MTGYGKAEIKIQDSNLTIEIKSLNSKQIYISMKRPSLYKDKEMDIRRLLSDKLYRGKINLSIWEEENEFEKHLQAIEYVERIQLYYQTLSILNREKEMLLLAVN